MRRFTISSLALVLVSGLVSSSSAVCLDDLCDQIHCGYCRNLNWPWPYVCPDRMHVREPFAIMVNNGWRRQNLLGNHHFDPETGKLATAGELKVHWIMTQIPPAHQQIFIERSVNPEVTSKRTAEVRAYAEKVAMGHDLPSIEETHLISEGRPAVMVDFVQSQFQENMKPPVLLSPGPDSSFSGN